MLIKNTCENCGGRLEFDVEHIGTTIDCPHCQQPTLLRGEFRRARPVARKSNKPAIIGAIVALVIAGLIGFGIYIHAFTAEDAAAGTGGLLMLVASICAAIVLLILIIFWLIFPWMVYSLLKRILATLEKIEAQTKP
jgi:hypothetical protein